VDLNAIWCVTRAKTEQRKALGSPRLRVYSPDASGSGVRHPVPHRPAVGALISCQQSPSHCHFVTCPLVTFVPSTMWPTHLLNAALRCKGHSCGVPALKHVLYSQSPADDITRGRVPLEVCWMHYKQSQSTRLSITNLPVPLEEPRTKPLYVALWQQPCYSINSR